ncbi:MAG: transcriptional regulator [Robiginitomaculum sp.]|nr:transcriptional regulator [Robiginitomaculum sp.]
MSNFNADDLDPVIHGKLRLGVMAYLSSAGSASFTTLREKTGSTDGNLSTHLRKLEDEGYIKIAKSFENRKPLSLVSMTDKGREKWICYLGKMRDLLGESTQKKA